MAAFAKNWRRDSSKDWEVRFRANRTLSRHRRMTGRDPKQTSGLSESPGGTYDGATGT